MDPLTLPEKEKLRYYENVIERGKLIFFQVGLALSTIRDERLYRTQYATFEAYCQLRWGFSRKYAFVLIQASDVIGNLLPEAHTPEDLSTIVDKLPANEAQTRPLRQLPPAERRGAWETAVATAPGGKVTAAHVAHVVSEITRVSAPEPAEPESEEAEVTPERAMCDLARLLLEYTVIERVYDENGESHYMAEERAIAEAARQLAQCVLAYKWP